MPCRWNKLEKLRELWATNKYRWLKGRHSFELSRSPFLRQLNTFSCYLRDYTSRPIYGTKEDSKPICSPWYLYEVSLLLRFNPGLTKAQAWNSPVGMSGWDNAGMAEALGLPLIIETPEDRKAQREAEAGSDDYYFDESANTWRAK